MIKVNHTFSVNALHFFQNQLGLRSGKFERHQDVTLWTFESDFYNMPEMAQL